MEDTSQSELPDIPSSVRSSQEYGKSGTVYIFDYLVTLFLYELGHTFLALIFAFALTAILMNFIQESMFLLIILTVIFGGVGLLLPSIIQYGQGTGALLLKKQDLIDKEQKFTFVQKFILQAFVSLFLLGLIYVVVQLMYFFITSIFITSFNLTSQPSFVCQFKQYFQSDLCNKPVSSVSSTQVEVSSLNYILQNFHLGEASYWFGRRMRGLLNKY